MNTLLDTEDNKDRALVKVFSAEELVKMAIKYTLVGAGISEYKGTPSFMFGIDPKTNAPSLRLDLFPPKFNVEQVSFEQPSRWQRFLKFFGKSV